MSVQRVYLVIGADKRIRAAKRPQIREDEVAIAVNLRFPDTWGRIIDTIEINIPDFAPAVEDLDGGAVQR
jgi:hypothetical protein